MVCREALLVGEVQAYGSVLTGGYTGALTGGYTGALEGHTLSTSGSTAQAPMHLPPRQARKRREAQKRLG